MKVLTIDEVIALQKGDPIEALTGFVKFLGKTERVNNNLTGQEEIKQSVLLQDGKATIWINVSLPEGQVVVLEKEDIGKKLYCTAGTNSKGKLSGLKRGASTTSKTRPGEMNHSVYLQGEASYTFREETTQSPALTLKSPGKPAPQVTESDPFSEPFENAATKPEETSSGGGFEDAPPLAEDRKAATASADPYAVLAVVSTQFEQCVVEAVKIANKTALQAGAIIGDANPWTGDNITAMAATIFIECGKRRAW